MDWLFIKYLSYTLNSFQIRLLRQMICTLLTMDAVNQPKITMDCLAINAFAILVIGHVRCSQLVHMEIKRHMVYVIWFTIRIQAICLSALYALRKMKGCWCHSKSHPIAILENALIRSSLRINASVPILAIASVTEQWICWMNALTSNHNGWNKTQNVDCSFRNDVKTK